MEETLRELKETVKEMKNQFAYLMRATDAQTAQCESVFDINKEVQFLVGCYDSFFSNIRDTCPQLFSYDPSTEYKLLKTISIQRAQIERLENELMALKQEEEEEKNEPVIPDISEALSQPLNLV